MTDQVLSGREGKIGLITINRPEAKNALNEPVRESIAAAVSGFDQDPEILCIVITGAGDSFAAGADLKDLAKRGAAEMLSRNTHKVWQVVSQCSKPIIAAVKGYAWGGGCELAMHADMIIAGESASFAQPEIKVGIMPGAGGTQRLVRLIGKSRAMKMLLTGKPINALEALQYGLVSDVVPDDKLHESAIELAETICRMPPIAVRQIKEVVHAGMDVPLSTALTLERKAFQLLFDTADQKEGMGAFLEKRRPEFKGR
jgi:enoyl-CoA hydratase/carnithine racemase